MNVYVTYEKDGYNGQQVEKVFASEADAQDWVIESRFSRNSYYDGKEPHELQEEALGYIEEHEIVEN